MKLIDRIVGVDRERVKEREKQVSRIEAKRKKRDSATMQRVAYLTGSREAERLARKRAREARKAAEELKGLSDEAEVIGTLERGEG